MKAGRSAFAALLALSLAACANLPRQPASGDTPAAGRFGPTHASIHRGADDLLTAGLGLEGLRAKTPPAFADPEHPTPAELRRRAIWSNWRGIADLAPGGGYGTLYGSTRAVPGREFSALAWLPGAQQPHRVLVQVPDSFDASKRCVVVAPAPGSRGVYGAIAVAAPWGLPKGCAVAYTDKGAGSDYFDLDAGLGVAVDGIVAAPGSDKELAFVPEAAAGASGIATRHAHSLDNPEADWGGHVRQAAQYALQVLDEAVPAAAPFRFDNTRVIAVGISDGGGAVLRAAEPQGSGIDTGWLDAVVAGEPDVYVAGGRPLYDFASEAALVQPCALLHVPEAELPQPPVLAQLKPFWAVRCDSLARAGLIPGGDTAAQAKAAHEYMRANGWTDAALRAGFVSSGMGLWRAMLVTDASAYGRYRAGAHPCGYGFSAQQTDSTPRAATAAERAAWWPDAAGIPPGNGVGIVDTRMSLPDFTLAGLQCLRALWQGAGADARRVRAGIAETRAGVPRAGLPVVVVHGLSDGLVPPAFSSAPYVAAARAAGHLVRYWQVRNAGHFDALLGSPAHAARFVPLLPYVYAALDRVDAHLARGAPLPADATVAATPRGSDPLDAADLAIPR